MAKMSRPARRRRSAACAGVPGTSRSHGASRRSTAKPARDEPSLRASRPDGFNGNSEGAILLPDPDPGRTDAQISRHCEHFSGSLCLYPCVAASPHQRDAGESAWGLQSAELEAAGSEAPLQGHLTNSILGMPVGWRNFRRPLLSGHAARPHCTCPPHRQHAKLERIRSRTPHAANTHSYKHRRAAKQHGSSSGSNSSNAAVQQLPYWRPHPRMLSS